MKTVHVYRLNVLSPAFFVSSHISALAPSGQGGIEQTRPNVVWGSRQVNHTFQAWFLWEQVVPLMVPGSLFPSEGTGVSHA
jgi:hypothetical protein